MKRKKNTTSYVKMSSVSLVDGPLSKEVKFTLVYVFQYVVMVVGAATRPCTRKQ